MIKKLQSKKDKNKKKKKNQRLLAIVLIFIMFGSVFGVIVTFFNSSLSKDKTQAKNDNYMGFDLTNVNGYYALTLGNKNLYLSTDPNDLQKIDILINTTKSLSYYSQKPLYIDSFNSYASQPIEQNLYGTPERISSACINATDCANVNAPIKTCKDDVIVIRIGLENKIYDDNNCVYIEAKKADMDEVIDSFLLRLSGIGGL